MAVAFASVSVTTTAALLSSATDTFNAEAGHSLQFTPPSAIYVGPAGVTTGTGYLLTAGVEYFYDLGPGEQLYGIVGAGSVSVPVLRIGV